VQIPLLLALLLLAGTSGAEEREAPAPARPVALALSHSQQQAVGIRSDHPVEMSGSPQVEAFGLVLDPALLVADAGRVDSTRAAARAAAAERARLASLYQNNAAASLKALQAAETVAIDGAAQAQAAAVTFALRWGPVASLGAAKRHALIDAVSAGQHLLVRADVPGQHVRAAIGRRALVEVDGLSVAARVLGPLPETSPQSQASGWLLEIDRRPDGFGPGARARVWLQGTPVPGLLVPPAALLYGEEGAYVYREAGPSGADPLRYEPVKVKLKSRVGDGWLVEGLVRTDKIVVQGAGVLWSLERIDTFSAAEAEHD
jgi:hypothetical protein